MSEIIEGIVKSSQQDIDKWMKDNPERFLPGEIPDYEDRRKYLENPNTFIRKYYSDGVPVEWSTPETLEESNNRYISRIEERKNRLNLETNVYILGYILRGKKK